MIRQIWPAGQASAVDDAELERLYRYRDEPKWLVVNYVSSADGAAAVEGRSGALSGPADRRVYWLGSDLADVVLLGAGTAVVEEFNGIHPNEQTAERRRRNGLAEVPPIAVVSTGPSLPPDAPVITEALTPTIVITCAAAPVERQRAWTDAGARVFVAGQEQVDLPAAVDMLVREGLRRIDCEGGPRLFGSLIEAGLVDELRLTISPLLVSGTADRIATGATIDPATLDLMSVLTDDSALLLRYRIKR